MIVQHDETKIKHKIWRKKTIDSTYCGLMTQNICHGIKDIRKGSLAADI